MKGFDLIRFRAGDHEHFTEIVAATRLLIRGLLKKRLVYLQDADLDEALQEMYLKAWRGRAQFRGESSIESWLCRIAINVVLGSHRRACARPQPTLVIEDLKDWHFDHPHAATPSPLRAAIARQSFEQLLTGRYIQPRVRKVVGTIAVGGTVRDAAQIAAVTVPTVKCILHRFRQEVRA